MALANMLIAELKIQDFSCASLAGARADAVGTVGGLGPGGGVSPRVVTDHVGDNTRGQFGQSVDHLPKRPPIRRDDRRPSQRDVVQRRHYRLESVGVGVRPLS